MKQRNQRTEKRRTAKRGHLLVPKVTNDEPVPRSQWQRTRRKRKPSSHPLFRTDENVKEQAKKKICPPGVAEPPKPNSIMYLTC